MKIELDDNIQVKFHSGIIVEESSISDKLYFGTGVLKKNSLEEDPHLKELLRSNNSIVITAYDEEEFATYGVGILNCNILNENEIEINFIKGIFTTAEFVRSILKIEELFTLLGFSKLIFKNSEIFDIEEKLIMEMFLNINYKLM